nr:hypothetical protein [Hyphomonas sp. Mor2]
MSFLQKISLALFAGLIVFAGLVAVSAVPAPIGEHSAKMTWFMSAAAFSGAIGLLLAWRGAPKAAWLATLLILSGASQLWLSDAGWFKTFKVDNFASMGLLAYGCILLQGLISTAVLCLDSQQWFLRSVRAAKIDQIVRVGLLFGLLTLASVSILSFIGTYDRSGYILQLVIGGAAMAASVAGVAALLFASDLDALAVSETMVETLERRAYLLIPLAFLVIAGLYSVFAFGRVPVVEDETAYLFQAKTLAGGAFHAPELPAGVSERFEFYLIPNDERGWYAAIVPGWPIVLAIGVWLGLPWLVNPVLGATSVWLGMTVWRRVTDRQQGMIVGLLMLASPWLLQTSASLMTHPLVLALTLGAWCLAIAAKDEDDQKWLKVSAWVFLAGLMMGWIFLTRALEGFLLGGLTGLWILWVFGRQRRLLPVITYGIGCLATGSLYFLFNLHMTGDLMSTPLMIYVNEFWGEGANAFGFGPDIGPPGGWGLLDLWDGHSLSEGIVNLNESVNALNTELYGWTMGSLSLLLIFLIWRRPGGANLAMLILAAVVILVHVFYWFVGTFYVGPRYWFGAFFAFIALSAGGYETLRSYVRSVGNSSSNKSLHTVLFILCGFSIIVFSSWRGAEKFHKRSEHARIMASYQLPTDASPGAIVILPCGDLFEGAMHRNDPFLRENRPIFVLANDQGTISDLETAFPSRAIVDAAELQGHCPN